MRAANIDGGRACTENKKTKGLVVRCVHGRTSEKHKGSEVTRVKMSTNKGLGGGRVPKKG